MSQQKAQLVNPIGNITVPGGIIVSGATTAGNFIGSFSGTATGLSGTPNLNVGVVTATAFYGDGSSLTGVAGSTFVGQSTTSQSPTTTIDLSLGNVIYFTHDTDTTVAFANTATTDSVTFIRTKDDSATPRTITWPDSVKWTGGSTPTLINSSQPNDAQIFNLLTRDSGDTWYAHEEVSYNPPQPFLAYSLGSNSSGVLGLNDIAPRSSPTQIPGTQWNYFSSSWNIGRALKTDGTLWSWGYNAYGQLGLNDINRRSSPTQIPGTQWNSESLAPTYSSGVVSSCIKTDGTLWAWGANSTGQLGLNDRVDRSSPTQIPGTTWAKTRSASDRTMWLIKTDGTMWFHGYSYLGTGGLNQSGAIYFSSPTQVPGNQWSDFNGGPNLSLALKSDNTFWSWGYASGGGSGHNTSTIHYSSPRQIPGTQWVSIIAGPNQNGGGIKNDGTLWLWGENGNGTLGLNDAVNRSSPTQIPGTQWEFGDMSENDNSIYCIKTDGTLWAWGQSGSGRFNNNEVGIPRSSPIQIPGTQWKKLNASQASLFLIK